VLGDSPIHYGTASAAAILTDERLAAIAPVERKRYMNRLRAGHGYGDEHRAAITALQQAQRDARNQRDGYWIAEAEPEAANHGVTLTLESGALTLAVLATDGAADLIDYTGQDWCAIAHYDAAQLAELLRQLDSWEAVSDPDGRQLPRAKRHDDKTIAVVSAVKS
jgi:hypothetical protein